MRSGSVSERSERICRLSSVNERQRVGLMLRHVAMIRFNDGVTDDEVRVIDEGLAGLPAVIDEIRNYSFGRDLGFSDTNYDYAVVAEFDSRADLDVYSDHPAHVKVLTTCIKPVLKDIKRIQFEI